MTARTGLTGVEGGRVAFADLNGDSWPDALLDRTKDFLNAPAPDGRRRFVRSAFDAPLNAEGVRRPDAVQVGDVNNDGVPDLFLGRYTDLSNKNFVDDGLRNEIWLGEIVAAADMPGRTVPESLPTLAPQHSAPSTQHLLRSPLPDGRGSDSAHSSLITHHSSLAVADVRYTRRPDAGVGDQAETTISACFVDYDRDGHLDLFVANSYVAYGQGLESFPNRLYRGRGDGTFEDVTEPAGLLGVAEPGRRDSRRPTYGVAHADWNNDGWPDLLTMAYGRQWNQLWRNNGDGTFTDVAETTHFDGDADRSGRYTDDVKKMFQERFGEDRTDEPEFRANGNTFDAAVADFDNDGDMDVFLAEITHWWAGPSSDVSSLLINGGSASPGPGPKLAYGPARPSGPWIWNAFRRAPERIPRVHTAEHWNQGDLHAGWIDVDNDGWLDLLIASSDYPDDQILRLFHQVPPRPDADGTWPDGGGRFEDWTDRLGFRWMNASQISLADFDHDGATDILVGTNNMRLTPEQIAQKTLNVGLFRNLAAQRAGSGFFNLRLLGAAIGARVIVTTRVDGVALRQTREVYGGLGHAGHRDDMDCRFGIGPAQGIERVEVRWPDAELTWQVFRDVPVNRFYTLRKGGELVELR